MNWEACKILWRGQPTRSVCMYNKCMSACKCMRCVLYHYTIPQHKSNKSQQTSSVAAGWGASRRFTWRIKGMCVCLYGSSTCTGPTVFSGHLYHVAEGWHPRYQKQAVLMPSLFALISLLSVSLGIPSLLLCVYRRDRLAIKSSQPWFSYLREIKVGSLRGAFWGLPLSYYLTRESLPPHPLCHYAQYSLLGGTKV